MDYYNKYIKYKNKYIQLNKQLGLGNKNKKISEIKINESSNYLIKLILLDDNLYKNVLCTIKDNNIIITLDKEQFTLTVNKDFIMNEIRFGRIIEVNKLEEKEKKESDQNSSLPISQPPNLNNNLIELLKQIWYT
jgi:hypothetical protein